MQTKNKILNLQQVDTCRMITIDPNEITTALVKTCGYVRVSSNSIDQLNSYASQLNHYSREIKNNPKYEFVGIYADEGISGTSAKARPEFKRMIAYCKAGKIDRILTKSISRFSRNTEDLMTTDNCA